VPTGKEPGHGTQGFTATSNSRTDCPDRDIYDRCGFIVTHTLQSDEQNHRPLLLGEFGHGAFQIAKLEPHRLIGRERQTRVGFLPFHTDTLPRISASVADVLMV